MKINKKDVPTYIYMLFYMLFIISMNSLFLYCYIKYCEINISNLKGYERNIFIYSTFISTIVCLIFIILTFIMWYFELNYYIKGININFFSYFGEIESKKTRFIFGIMKVIISSSYLQYNSNIKETTTITVAKSIFSTIYFIIGAINIFISYSEKFKIKNKNLMLWSIYT